MNILLITNKEAEDKIYYRCNLVQPLGGDVSGSRGAEVFKWLFSVAAT